MHGALLATALAGILIIAPFYIHAQADISARGDLAIAVKNAILSDPRSANLSPEQINTMAYALTEKASAQSITPHDLYWRPTLAHTIMVADSAVSARNNCGKVPAFMCALNKTLGFSGADMTILILLGVLIMLILAVIAGYLELEHRGRIRLQG